jgi:hypothetical protein
MLENVEDVHRNEEHLEIVEKLTGVLELATGPGTNNDQFIRFFSDRASYQYPSVMEPLITKLCYIYFCRWLNKTETFESFKKNFKPIILKEVFELSSSTASAGKIGSVLERFEAFTKERAVEIANYETFWLGCNFFKSFPIQQLQIGPVEFLNKKLFLDRLSEKNLISGDSVAQLLSWQSEEKNSNTLNHTEGNIISCTEDCSHVVSISGWGRSEDKVIKDFIWITKLAFISILLFLGNPSNYLSDFGTKDSKEYKALGFLIEGAAGVGFSGRLAGSFENFSLTEEDWQEFYRQHKAHFHYIGQVLETLVSPEVDLKKATQLSRILVALTWLDKGCREEVDFVAISSFASCIDCVAGGSSKNGIVKFVEKHWKLKKEQRFIRQGETVEECTKQIYSLIRNDAYHGSITSFVSDHSRWRTIAEDIAVSCLRVAINKEVERERAKPLEPLR